MPLLICGGWLAVLALGELRQLAGWGMRSRMPAWASPWQWFPLVHRVRAGWYRKVGRHGVDVMPLHREQRRQGGPRRRWLPPQ